MLKLDFVVGDLYLDESSSKLLLFVGSILDSALSASSIYDALSENEKLSVDLERILALMTIDTTYCEDITWFIFIHLTGSFLLLHRGMKVMSSLTAVCGI